MNAKGCLKSKELVVVGITLILLTALAISSLNRTAKRISCRSNLRDFSLVSRQWLIDHDNKMPWHISVTNGGAMEPAEEGNVALVFEVMSNYLTKPSQVYCPADKRRAKPTTLAAGLANSNVSYFVGIDAKEDSIFMFAFGDDHLAIGAAPASSGVLMLTTNSQIEWTRERHKRVGNIALVDGSAHSYDSDQLVELLRSTRVATNRLAIP